MKMMIKAGIKVGIKQFIQALGFELIRIEKPDPNNPLKDFYHETDETFLAFNRQAIAVSQSPHDPNIFPLRLYNTLQFFLYSLPLEGDVVECGCFKGRSSYLFCRYTQHILGEYLGQDYHIFDSFAGISEPGVQDLIPTPTSNGSGQGYLAAGAFAAGLDHVKHTLKDFPQVQYHPGWIPDCFREVPDLTYKFVHLDLDLYEPILASLEYFYPRLVPGGVIVIDEYALPRWPGAKRAVDEFCQRQGLTPLGLTTGNGVIIKMGT